MQKKAGLAAFLPAGLCRNGLLAISQFESKAMERDVAQPLAVLPHDQWLRAYVNLASHIVLEVADLGARRLLTLTPIPITNTRE